MKVLVLGSTGFIGSAVTDRLIDSGHQVVCVSREPDVRRPGATVTVGDLAAPESLRAAVTPDVDAVVHVAAPLGDWVTERESVQAMLEALGADSKVLVYISGTWVLGPGGSAVGAEQPLDEASPPAPIAIVDGRETVESLVLESSVRGVVLRPGIVYGRGGGIPGLMAQWAREDGRGRYVGTEDTTWPVVHVDDVARLVRLVLVDDRANGILHGVTQSAVPVAALAAAADVAAGGSGASESWPLADASAALGRAFAEALATSQAVGSERACALGWNPEHVDVLADLARGSYAAVNQHA